MASTLFSLFFFSKFYSECGLYLSCRGFAPCIPYRGEALTAGGGPKGLPNAGKSSLLAAVTVAKPEIAAYPFTTLMPNLGCLEGDPLKNDGGFSSGATMADLPGLIKDAHLGKVVCVLLSSYCRPRHITLVLGHAPIPVEVVSYSIWGI